MADFSTLTEPFTTALDTGRWFITASGGSPAITSGSELLIRPDSSGVAWSNYIRTQAYWGLNTTAASAPVVEFVPHATRNNGRAVWGICNGSAQGLAIEQLSATSYRSVVNNGSSLSGSVTYTTTDRFWRVYLDTLDAVVGTLAYIESSPDGVTWTARGTQDMSSATVGFSWRTGGSLFQMYFTIVSGSGSTPAAAFRGINEYVAPPTSITAAVATATSRFPLPDPHQIGFTSVFATLATASALLPAPSLSRFASTVVQTPQNWGGAAVYYRLNDATTTLTDDLGRYPGGWSGTKVRTEGAVVGDPDLATLFDGTSTVAYNGVMPRYDPFFAADQGFRDGGRTQWRADEQPRLWGFSAMVVFRTLPGATKQLFLFSRDTPGLLARDLYLSVEQGRLNARWYAGSDWQDLIGPSVNDGAWHMAVMTTGYPLDDDLDLGHQKVNRLYLDGVLQGTLNVAPTVPTRPLSIGGFGGVASMEGTLDEYAEYDYAVSAWEVRELWNQLKNLTGPPLRVQSPTATAQITAPIPAVRKSVVRPLNEFYDDFSGTEIDRTKWRDASATARVIDGAAVLRASGERLLTQDYFQAKDSTFVIRVDRLPLREGHTFVGLVNEHDIVPDAVFGGVNQVDALRPHRTIGFDIYRKTVLGRTTTTLSFTAVGASVGYGSKTRSVSINYVPDDPNYPTPHKWLRLDIDPGANGGATWYTSPDGVTWNEQYDVHGGKVNVTTTPVIGSNGQAVLDSSGSVVTESKTTYEDVGGFYLFDPGIGPADVFPGGVVNVWQGYMRVLVQEDGGNAATNLQVDNVNVLPQGTGTPFECLAKPVRVQTSSSTDYLLYALNPRIYSSAQDISVEAKPGTATATFLTPPEAVHAAAPVALAQATLLAPQRAGQAVPVQVLAVAATATGLLLAPARAGEAQPISIQVVQGSASAQAHEPDVDTSQSSPAPVAKTGKRVITLKVRRVRATVTQN